MKQRIHALALCLTMLFNINIFFAARVSADNETYPRLEDTSQMSDEAFFGVWNDTHEIWTTVGKLNYAYSEELAEVERYVKLGSYDMAKEELLLYYQNRTNITTSKDYSGFPDERAIFYIRQNMLVFDEELIAPVTIFASDDYRRYEVDLENLLDGVTLQFAQGAFLLQAADKSEDIVSIVSKEGDPERAPRMLFYLKNGRTLELPVIKDSYIRAYDPNETYRDNNYGTETELLIKDSAYLPDSGIWQPFDSKTRRAYMNFRTAGIPRKSEVLVAKLIFYAKLIPEEGSTGLTANSKDILICDSANKAWRETSAEQGSTPVLTWRGISHYSFSWNGLPGGIYWKTSPEGAASEFLNYNTRFYAVDDLMRKYMRSGDESYVYDAMASVNDYISDAGARIPAGRELEPANRAIVLPPAYLHFIQSSFINPDANIAMLKYLWEEATFLNEGFVYYFGINRALWHDTGFFSIISYFPEFADSEKWWETWDERIDLTLESLIFDDGCYSEPTYGYPNAVVDWLLDIGRCFKDAGMEPPQILYDKALLLTRYLMYSSYPNGESPYWGEGGTSPSRELSKKIGELFDDESLIYWGTDGDEGVEPQSDSMKFTSLKLVTSRTDWSSDASMIFINAANGGNHAHRDSLALGYYVKGRELLRDTGMTTYDAGHPHFDWQRHQTRSHNTVEIDGKAQRGDHSTLTGNGDSDIQLYPGETIDRVFGWTEATLGFRHNRKVTFLKDLDFLIVSDMIAPMDNEEHFYRQNWHFLPTPVPSTTLDSVTKTGETHFPEGTNVKVIQARPETVDASFADGYDHLGQNDTKYLQYERKQIGNTAFDTVIFPVTEGNTTDVSVQSLSVDADPAIASAMEVKIERNTDEFRSVVYYNSNEDVPSQREFGEFETDAASIVMTRDADNAAQSIGMYGGTVLAKNGEIMVQSDALLADISVSFHGKTVNLTSSDSLANEAKLMITAPHAVNTVTLNGVSVDTIIKGNRIYVNYEGDEPELFEGDGTVFDMQITVDGKIYSVKVEIPAGTVVTDGIISKPMLSYENGKIKLTFSGGTLDKAMKITVTGHANAAAYMVKDGNQVSVLNTTAMTQAQADAGVFVGAPKRFALRRDLEIWTKDLAAYEITSPPVDNALPPTGSGGGGGSLSLSEKGKNESLPSEKLPLEDNGQEITSFTDIEGHWAETEIKEMAEIGIVRGIDEERFAPDALITRAEFAALLVRALGLTEAEYDGEFSDVSDNDWFAGAVAAASGARIVLGSDGAFLPNDGIRREEMAAMIMRTYESRFGEVDMISRFDFEDAAEFSDWAASSIQKAVSLGLMNGISNTSFGAKEPATRAQAAVILHRFLVIIDSKEALK